MIIFNHLPKCGGTSINRLLEARFGDRYVRHEPLDWARVLEDLACDRLDCISGHYLNMPAAVRPAFFDARHVRLSLVRDPVERFISAYHFFRHVRPDLDPQGAARSLPLDRFFYFAVANDWAYVRNTQAEQLCGRAEVTPNEALLFCPDTYAAIGSVERIDAFVDLLTARGLLPPGTTAGRENPAPRDSAPLDPQVEGDLLARVSRDRVLAEWIHGQGVIGTWTEPAAPSPRTTRTVPGDA